jgi:AGCS family alanine or glycine:cation symporter
MIKRLLALLLTLLPLFTFAEGAADKVDELFRAYTGWFVNAIFYEIPFTDNFKIPWVLIVLVGGALYFTVYFKFINFSGFITALRVVRGNMKILKSTERTRYTEMLPIIKTKTS